MDSSRRSPHAGCRRAVSDIAVAEKARGMTTYSYEYSTRVCLDCPIRILLLQGLPLPQPQPISGKGKSPTGKKLSPARSEPCPEPIRCCMGFRLVTSRRVRQEPMSLEEVILGKWQS